VKINKKLDRNITKYKHLKFTFFEINQMFRFIAYLEPTPKLKTKLTKLSIVSVGLLFGYIKGYLVN
jgi:hypothetical protein